MIQFSCRILLLSLVIVGCRGSVDRAHLAQPNVLFILADDLGYYDLSCMGSRYYETPHIDGIAAHGTTFTNGYATCQVCSPSRASILTGKFPARHGITDWIGARTGEAWRTTKRFSQLLPADYVQHLPHQDITVAEAFKAAGYNTFFAGKWHLGNEGSYPEDHGFDINQGGYERGGPYTGGFFSPFHNPKMTDYPEEKGMSLSMKLATETANFITKHQGQPFFAYLSFYAVHAPIQTTEDKWKYYRDRAEEMGVDSVGFKMERRLPIRQHQDNPVYAGLIEQMDEGVGHVLKSLEDLGIDKNTIVIFTSDNGGVASGDAFSTSNAPLRGGKGYQWEGGIKVPYIVSVPWLEHSDRKSDRVVTGTDFYPSLLDLASLPLQKEQHLDGRSFLSALTSDGRETDERSLIWHYPHYGNQGGDPSSIIRKGRWKLIHYFEDNHVELYDIETDQSEEDNVADRYPDVTRQLSQELKDWWDELEAKFPERDIMYSADSAAVKEHYYSTILLKRLENRRKNFLNKEWQPNEDWWGSKGTVD